MIKFLIQRTALIVPGAVCLLALTGCNRNEVKFYEVSKENDPHAGMPAGMPHNHPEVDVAHSRPGLTWTLPSGWSEAAPGDMRVASFKIAAEGGKQAEVSVIPIGGTAGGDVANVNRWRGQVGLAPLAEGELRKTAEKVEIAGGAAELYDLDGTNPGNGEPYRILAAIQHRDGTAWFFKMMGDSQLVTKQKEPFIAFLKSVQFGPPASVPPPMASSGELPAGHPEISQTPPMSAPPAMTPASASNEGKPSWTVPSAWSEVPGGQFLVAKFLVDGNPQNAVNVSMSAGEGGGLVGNVNRWRGQLGLTPLPDAEVQKIITTIDLQGGKASMVDMTGTDPRSGQPARVIGAIVPRQGQTWFYKLMGDAKVVEGQKDAFTAFVQSVKY